MTYRLFADVGFGFTKAIDSNGRQTLYPSIFSETQPNLDGTERGIHCDFGSFLFGDSASNNSAMARQFREYSDCLTDAYAANVLMAISELNGSNVVDVSLCLSLPYQSMRAGLDYEVMKRLAGNHEIKSLKRRSKQTINIDFPVKWPVMPQNVAPAFVSLSPNGRFRSDGDGLIWIGIINVGSKTLELGTFGIDVNSYSLRASNQQMTFAKGVYTLADSVRLPLLDELLTVYGKSSLTQHEIFKVLRDNYVSIGNEKVSMSHVISVPKGDYLDTVYRHCLENWTTNRGKEPADIWQFCVSGGGAHIVEPYLQEIGFHNNIVVSSEPQFDVCAGSMNWHKLIGG